ALAGGVAYDVRGFSEGELSGLQRPGGHTAGSVGVTTQRLLRVSVECAPDRLARLSSGVGVIAMQVHPHGPGSPYGVGLMVWLRRNTFVGSYCFFSTASRW